MTAFIGRRQFITLFGGAATAWPLATRAQQGERMQRVGVLMNIAADDADAPVRVAAFAQGLQELGWTIGRNLRIEYRWTAGEADRIRRYAAEISAFSPDVIIASGGAHAAAVQRAAPTVPIVFLSVNDPVAAGLVSSLARPGGNCHGFHRIGIWHQRQVAGAAQADRPRRYTGGGPSIRRLLAGSASWGQFRARHHRLEWR